MNQKVNYLDIFRLFIQFFIKATFNQLQKKYWLFYQSLQLFSYINYKKNNKKKKFKLFK